LNYYNSNNILNQNNAVNAIDQMALLISLWRGKWILFILVLLGVVIADFYVRRIAVPLYPATATIALQDEKVQIISDIESIMFA
jgi:LPS O-antigen subunit length determinant protein (WzzB/FepE family)